MRTANQGIMFRRPLLLGFLYKEMQDKDFSLGGRFENRGGRHTAASFVYQGKIAKTLNKDFSLGGRFENRGGRRTAASFVYQGKIARTLNKDFR